MTSGGRRPLAPAVAALATAAGLAVALFALYRPVLSQPPTSDDFQWLQLAHRARHQPAYLLADLDTFYRPASTWTLVLDRLVWGYRTAGYHATNLALHTAAALLLAAAARRLGLSGWVALAVAAMWALSPFCAQPAMVIAIRFECLLAGSWFATIAAWPGRPQPWSRRRIAAVAAALALAAASKETFVASPLLVLALAWCGRHRRRHIVLATLATAVAAALYIAAYFAAFPSDKGYFSYDPRVLWKGPHLLASFLGTTRFLRPLGFEPSWPGGVAMAALAGVAILGFARRSPAIVVGLALAAAAFAPTALVPFLPTRHSYLPYAGFLLAAAGTAVEGHRYLSPRRRPLLVVGLAVAAGLHLVRGLGIVRGGLEDQARVARATGRLLDEAGAVIATLPRSGPLLVVRDDTADPLLEVARTPRGWPQVWYPRHADSYGLADTAALFEWALAEDRTYVLALDQGIDGTADGDAPLRGVPGWIVAHTDAGFELLGEVADTAATRDELRQRFRLRVVEIVPRGGRE